MLKLGSWRPRSLRPIPPSANDGFQGSGGLRQARASGYWSRPSTRDGNIGTVLHGSLIYHGLAILAWVLSHFRRQVASAFQTGPANHSCLESTRSLSRGMEVSADSCLEYMMTRICSIPGWNQDRHLADINDHAPQGV
jgi:hypothetical protein